MGKHGRMEDQTTRVAHLINSSSKLSDAGIYHATVIYHPSEGLIVTGKEQMSRALENMLVGPGREQLIDEACVQDGDRLNHYSSRKEKERLMQRIYKTNLPPLHLPLSELRTLVLLQAAFGRAWEPELSGLIVI